MNVLELNVTRRLVFVFAGIVFGIETVLDVAGVVDDEDVADANSPVVEQRFVHIADDLDEVLVALQTLQAESDPGHDGLLLFDDHAGVGSYRAEVEVILDAEREPEHKREQQEQASAKTFDESRNLHRDTKRNGSGLLVVVPGRKVLGNLSPVNVRLGSSKYV